MALDTTVLFFHFGRVEGGGGAQTECSSEKDDAKNLFFFHGVRIVQLAGHPTEKPDAILTVRVPGVARDFSLRVNF